ncbi:MAG: carboxypeptidase-like regulatory domain-containing protein, partial [bacterium]
MRLRKTSFCVTALILTTLSSPIDAGTLATIRGKVIDKSTHKPVPNASVQIAGTTIGDEADAGGNYVLSHLKAGTYYVKAMRIGYEEKVEKVVLNTGEDKTYDIYVTPTTLTLRSVEIKAERFSEKYLTKASQINVHRMRARDIITIPGAFDDPLRAVQIFNGVAGGGDYSGYMAVRGGSPDQNQVIMDGVIIPSPYRFRLAFGAGLSSINPNTIQDIYLHLGGFSAEYGNSLSSILEVESKTGNRKEVRAQGTLNLTDANGIIESPLPFANGSFLFSVRRTYYDIFANSFSKSDSAFPFHFGVGSRVAFQIDGNNRIYVNFFRNREGTELLDELSDNLGITEDATTHLLSISWRGSPSEKWQFDSSVSYY